MSYSARIRQAVCSIAPISLVRSELKMLKINCIKKIIEEKGLSQAWIARKMNKTTNTLNGWCLNKCQPHLIDLHLLAALLDCHASDLIIKVNVKRVARQVKRRIHA